jgi:tetratricopeptide (TPR) repeat protein
MFPPANKYLNFKNAFYILSLILLVVLPLLSRNAGISGDEEIHYKQSEKVINYIKSSGEDKSVLHTPTTHLKYYGQLFDNITTIFIKCLNIEDIYQFRHIANSVAGWGTILISGLLASFIAGYRTGFLTLLLFMVSSRFLGHTWNNLKDIPFALGYIITIYFIFLFIRKLPKHTIKHVILLVLGLAFAIGVRAGGIILICYLFLFTGLYFVSNYIGRQKWITSKNILNSFFVILIITVLGYLSGLVLWPFGLENPLKNPWLSFKVMTQFPTTVRQVFEGSVWWSDRFPWYYLLKYMLISIPTIVLSGFLVFIVFIKSVFKSQNWIFIFFLVFSFLFPLVFIIINDANVYGAWRHMIFIYPPLVVLSALGYDWIIKNVRLKIFRIGLTVILLVLCIHPVKFIIKNHPYEYLYFNELTGGIKGAYGNYETDYYFHSIREASLWLQNHIEKNNLLGEGKIKVGSNFPVSWLFREWEDKITTQYIKYYSRGNYDWDFAIIANAYINPFQLRNNIWPPENTIHTIKIDNIPVCAIIERKTKDDYQGYVALKENNYNLAISLFTKGLKTDPANESVYINLSIAYLNSGNVNAAKKYLNKCLEIYPEYEVVIYQLAKIHHMEGQTDEAIELYARNLENNYKHFPSYIGIAMVYFDTGENQFAVKNLKRCIGINPGYKPALITLGNYYKKTGKNELAKKYLNSTEKI